MEPLLQKYAKYFYITLICVISLQLLTMTIKTLCGEMQVELCAQVFLYILNLILVCSNMRNSIKQQFVECKANAKILRFTLALLLTLQAVICFKTNPDWVILGNHILMVVIVEIVLNYRIRSIEYLEKLVDQFASDKSNKKGD